MASEWQPIESAPKDGLVMLLMGETVPDHPWLEVGRYTAGNACEELGYREFAKYGGWLIWNAPDNYYVCDVKGPTHWQPLPEPPVSP